jgi:NADPH:quinone reductase-like Zn-dependent oxidoreductase
MTPAAQKLHAILMTHGATLRQAVAALSGWLASEAIRPPDFQTMRLADARHAHERLEQGGVQGRILLVPA